MRTNEEIIDLLKNKIENSSMSMTELATRAGVSKSTLSRYLSYSRDFPLNKADDFAKALSMTTEQFLGVGQNNIINGTNNGINSLSGGSGTSTNTYNFGQNPDNQGSHNDTMRDLGIADVKLSRSILNRLDRQIEYQREQMELQRSIDRRLETIVDLQEEILDEIRLVTRKKD